MPSLIRISTKIALVSRSGVISNLEKKEMLRYINRGIWQGHDFIRQFRFIKRRDRNRI